MKKNIEKLSKILKIMTLYQLKKNLLKLLNLSVLNVSVM